MNSDFTELVIKQNNKGRGLYTKESLPLNARICFIRGREINFEDTRRLQNESFALQTGEDKYILPEYPFYLFNHSCDPNCGISAQMELVTIRPVKKGEELCWDYSTSMMERSWKMHCNCGSENCRKIIYDFDQLNPNIQHRYIEMGIVLPYVLEEIYHQKKHDYSPH